MEAQHSTIANFENFLQTEKNNSNKTNFAYEHDFHSIFRIRENFLASFYTMEFHQE